MATNYVKPTVRNAWAETAGPSDLTDPGNSFASAGWLIGAKPPRQYFNWVLNWASEGVRYLCQSGCVDYDAAETYQIGDLARGSDTIIYRCIVANNIGHDPTTSPTFWSTPIAPTATAGDNSTKIATTAFVTANFLKVGSTFSNIFGSIAPGQVPVGAVTQWQGALSLTFPQITGVVSNAQIPSGAVTQWQGNLAIAWTQITGTKNADQLNGLVSSSAATGGTVAARDANGYLYAVYHFQSSPNNENPTISQVMVTNGTDNFLRKASLAKLFASFVPDQTKAQTGHTTLPGGIIVNWGYNQGSGISPAKVAVVFDQPFATSFFVGMCSTKRSTGGAAGSGYICSSPAPTLSGMTCMFDSLDGQVNVLNGGYWIAIGI